MKKRVFAVLTVLCLVATMFVALVIPVSAANQLPGVFAGQYSSALPSFFNSPFSITANVLYQKLNNGLGYFDSSFETDVVCVMDSSVPLSFASMYFANTATGSSYSRCDLSPISGTNIYYRLITFEEWRSLVAAVSPNRCSVYAQASTNGEVSAGILSVQDFVQFLAYKTGAMDIEYTPSISMYQLLGYQQLPSENVNFHPELVQTYSTSVPVGGSASVSLSNPLYYYGMQYVEILVVFPYAPVPVEEMPRFAYVNGFYGSGASRVLWNDTGGFWYSFLNEQNEAFSAFRILCPYEIFNNSFAGIEIQNISQTVLNVDIQVFPYEAADPFLMAQNVTYNSAYETGQNAGYNRGFNDGVEYSSSTSFDEGYAEGRQDGYATGYAFGHSAGYSEGQNDEYSFSTFIGAVIDAPIQYLSSMFNFTILGFDMKTAFFSIISLCVLVTIVRVFI